MGGVYFAYMGRRNPLTDWAQFFLGERYLWHNHACQIWWRSLKGFRGSCGSNFSISHWLCWSYLQHSHTTVWACDGYLPMLAYAVLVLFRHFQKVSLSEYVEKVDPKRACWSNFTWKMSHHIKTSLKKYILWMDICLCWSILSFKTMSKLASKKYMLCIC